MLGIMLLGAGLASQRAEVKELQRVIMQVAAPV